MIQFLLPLLEGIGAAGAVGGGAGMGGIANALGGLGGLGSMAGAPMAGGMQGATQGSGLMGALSGGSPFKMGGQPQGNQEEAASYASMMPKFGNQGGFTNGLNRRP